MALNQKVARRGSAAQYHPPIWAGENKSGCVPIGEKILILPYMAVAKTTGGIEIPDEFKERMQLSAEMGVIVSIGDDAFTWNADRTRPFGGYKPKVGDHVFFERYAGAVVQGDDGREYRVAEDKQIGAVLIKA
jgi:chaperonin GroES